MEYPGKHLSNANRIEKVIVLPFFMDIIIGAWCIWKERNAYIFNNKPPSVFPKKKPPSVAWKALFTSEVKPHLRRQPATVHL